MKPNEGRLQTAKHILAHTLEHKLPDAKVIIAKFDGELGRMEIATAQDLRCGTKQSWKQR
jgi:hypothetical protein